MKQLSIFLLLAIFSASGSLYAQNKPTHPISFYESMGKTTKWVDRYVREEFGLKPLKQEIGEDTVKLSFYNGVNDMEISLFFVSDALEYIGFNDFSLENNEVNTFFTQWCVDVSDHYKLISEKSERFPMFEDITTNMVFYIPDEQQLNQGIQYYMFTGFIRSEQILTQR